MRRFYFLFIALTLSLGCMAQGFPPYRSGHRPPQHRSGNRPMREVNPEYKMTAETFVADSLVSSEYTLNYYKKQYAAVGDISKKPCLFVYLHGGGGRDGKDNRYIQHAAIHTLDKYLTEKGIDAMVVAPKCTKGNSWATISKHVYSMIESLVADYNIDVSRIYLMGTSFGAQGGWALLSERPDLFAATQLASAAPKRYVLENVVKTPIYFTLGENDMDNPEDYKKTIRKFRKAGAEIEFKILPGLNHFQACNQAYTAESIEFLLKH